MSYLDEMVAHSIAEERERDILLTLRREQLATRQAPTVTTVTTPQHHGRWHDALVRLHVLHTPTT